MYDPYRERLVMETQTDWADTCSDVAPAARMPIELRVHENPAAASQLEYIRTHTGFCRRITVTPEDLERLGMRRTA